MSSVDNRVVKMSFDNAEFEKNAGTTLGTLDKLKQSLDFSGAAKGMEEIQASANGVNFEAIASGIEALNQRFSVLGEFVHNTFMNMLSQAIDVGKSISDALVITPAKEGFAEYELQMNSVQTIMASTGESVDVVNGYLDELNTYADKTIYSFSDMTQNIGKFTNAGVKLPEAVAAIQGVSNVAAVAGANTNEASRAMYNFAQALSAGSVKLIDWKSIENANMATVDFKNQLIDTAVAMGTLTKEGDQYISTTTDMQGKVSAAFDATHSFNESLSAQWMTTDVLVQTLEQYSKDVRDMTEEEQEEYKAKLMSIYGDEQKVESIIELGKKAADSAKDVKTFTQLIDTLKESLGSGWTKTWQLIIGDLEEAKSLWSEIYITLDKYISAMSNSRNNLLEEWAKGGGRVAIIDSLRNTFQALVSVMEPIGQAWEKVFPPTTAATLIEYSNKLKDFTAGLKLTEEDSRKLGSAMQMVFSFLKDGFNGIINIGKTVWSVLKTIGEAIGEAFGITYISRIGLISTRFREFTEAIKPSEATLENLGKIVKGVASVIRTFLYIAVEAGSAVFDALGKVFTGLAPEGESFMELLGRIGDWLSSFADKVQEIFNRDTFAGGFDAIAEGSLKAWDAFKHFMHLDGIVEALKNFFKVPEENSGVFNVLETVGNIFNKIKETVFSLLDKLKESNVDITKVLGVGAGGMILKKIYDILKAILDSLDSEEDTSKWKDHLLEIKDAVIDTFGSIQESVKADMLKKIAISIGILAASLWLLSTIDVGSLVASLGAISALMAELDFMMKQISNLEVPDKKSLTAITFGLIGLSTSILILSVATKELSTVDPEELARGLLAVTILLGEMTGVAKIFSTFEKDLAKGALSLVLLAGAVALLTIPVKQLGEMDIESLVKGLDAVLVLLAELTLAADALPSDLASKGAGVLILAAGIALLAVPVKQLGEMDIESLVKGLGAVLVLLAEIALASEAMPSDMIAKGAGILIMAGGIAIMADAVKILGGLDIESLVKGLGAILVLLAEMVLAANAMEGALPGAVAMLAMAAAMVPLAIALNMIAVIPIPALITGLIGMAAAIAIFGAAGVILTPLAPGLLAVAGALALFGLGVLAVGTGIGIAAAAVSVGGIALIEFIKQLILMIPELGIKIGEMFLNFVTTLAEQTPILLEALSTLIQTILVAIGENIPLITETVLSLLTQLLQQLAEFVPQMAEAGLKIILGFLQAVADNIQQIVEAGISIAVNFILGVAEKLPEVIDAAFKLIISFIEGLASAIDENHMALFEAIGHLIRSIVEAIIDGIIHIKDAAGELVSGFTENLDPWDVVRGIFDAGANLVQGFIDGIKSLAGALWNAACDLAHDAWNAISSTLDMHSPSRVALKGGINFVQGLINGMEALRSGAVSEAGAVAYGAISALEAGLDNIDTNLVPIYTPVIDFSEVQNGIDDVNGLVYSLPDTYGITASIKNDNALRRQLVDIMSSGNDYTSILSGMSDLRQGIDELGRQITNMQVIMDSGALVGAITPQVDEALGYRQIMVERGVL